MDFGLDRWISLGSSSSGTPTPPPPTFDPTSIGGCVLWLRSDLGVTVESGNLTKWVDQVQGLEYGSTPQAPVPTWNAGAGVNGHDQVQFLVGDGSVQPGTGVSNSGMHGPSPFIPGVDRTVICVTAYAPTPDANPAGYPCTLMSIGLTYPAQELMYLNAGATYVQWDIVNGNLIGDPAATSYNRFLPGPMIIVWRIPGNNFFPMQFALNGVDQGTMGGVSNEHDASEGLYLGLDAPQDGNGNFSGEIDDIFAYNRLLTDDELLTLYQQYTTPRYAVP